MNLFENNGAHFSDDKKHRYALWRIWDTGKPMVMCIGLNPSTAKADKNDATIGILTRMLTKLGYGGFFMVNLYTYITSKPSELKFDDGGAKWADIIMEYGCGRDVIFAWGNFKKTSLLRTEWVTANYNGLCFGKNKNGTPYHPMVLMYNGTQNTPQLCNYSDHETEK